MGTSKAFVFSLDSFVAFVLTVAALYSLLFFATVPSAYYSSLMQANYLAKDTLLTLATTTVSEDIADSDDLCDQGVTYLSCIISEGDEPARIYVGSEGPEGIYDASALIPAQFGYKIEYLEYELDDEDEIDFENANWNELYDTAKDPDSANKKEYNKLKAAAHALFIDYEELPDGGDESPLNYMTCGGEYTICDWSEPFAYYDEYEGNSNDDIVGDAYAYVVRLTVYT